MSNELMFRTLTLEDQYKLFEIYSDKESMKYRGSSAMESLEDAKQYIRNQKLLENGVLTIRKGIELISEKVLIGSVMYRFQGDIVDECEIGYSIGGDFWGRGLGKEIVRLLLTTIEENKEIKKVIAWCNKDNIASIKILQRNGFERQQSKDIYNNYYYQKTLKVIK